MQNETVARRYAIAIFSLAKERHAIDAVGNDLRIARSLMQSNEDLRRFFTSPVIGRAQKTEVFAEAFKSFHEVALHSVLLLIRKRREGLLVPIVAEYEKLALADTGREPLEITSARPVSQPELDEMVARLERIYRKRFEVKQTVRPELLGGVRITMGDRRVDGTIAGRLDDFARELSTRKQ
jgi:F-type H+-transporting ATPase subunit delta